MYLPVNGWEKHSTFTHVANISLPDTNKCHLFFLPSHLAKQASPERHPQAPLTLRNPLSEKKLSYLKARSVSPTFKTCGLSASFMVVCPRGRSTCEEQNCRLVAFHGSLKASHCEVLSVSGIPECLVLHTWARRQGWCLIPAWGSWQPHMCAAGENTCAHLKAGISSV